MGEANPHDSDTGDLEEKICTLRCGLRRTDRGGRQCNRRCSDGGLDGVVVGNALMGECLTLVACYRCLMEEL